MPRFSYLVTLLITCLASVSALSAQTEDYECENLGCETPAESWTDLLELELFVPEMGKSTFSVESIYPLFGTECCCNRTLFLQGRMTVNPADTRICQWDSSKTFSVGLGYRRLIDACGCTHFGVNHFWDFGTNDYRRFGVGFELIGPLFELRGNWYESVGNQVTHIRAPLTTQYTRTLDGGDITLESQIPYLPWLRSTVGYYRWIGIGVPDLHGWSRALRAELHDYFWLEVNNTSDQNTNSFSFRIGIRMGRPNSVTHTASDRWYDSCRWTARDICCLQLKKVRRNPFFARQCREQVLAPPAPPEDDNDEFG